MGAPRTTPKVLAALQAFTTGVNVSVADLADESGLETEQVRSAMRKLIESEKHKIDVVLRGNTWRYFGPAANVPGQRQPEVKEDHLFERIGKLASGEVLVRGDQTETIYVVTELALER